LNKARTSHLFQNVVWLEIVLILFKMIVQTLTEPRAPWKSRNEIIWWCFMISWKQNILANSQLLREDISLRKNILELDLTDESKQRIKINWYTFLNAYSLLIWWKATYIEQKIRYPFRARKSLKEQLWTFRMQVIDHKCGRNLCFYEESVRKSSITNKVIQ